MLFSSSRSYLAGMFKSEIHWDLASNLQSASRQMARINYESIQNHTNYSRTALVYYFSDDEGDLWLRSCFEIEIDIVTVDNTSKWSHDVLSRKIAAEAVESLQFFTPVILSRVRSRKQRTNRFFRQTQNVITVTQAPRAGVDRVLSIAFWIPGTTLCQHSTRIRDTATKFKYVSQEEYSWTEGLRRWFLTSMRLFLPILAIITSNIAFLPLTFSVIDWCSHQDRWTADEWQESPWQCSGLLPVLAEMFVQPVKFQLAVISLCGNALPRCPLLFGWFHEIARWFDVAKHCQWYWTKTNEWALLDALREIHTIEKSHAQPSVISEGEKWHVDGRSYCRAKVGASH
jgi:hypothetical protein